MTGAERGYLPRDLPFPTPVSGSALFCSSVPPEVPELSAAAGDLFNRNSGRLINGLRVSACWNAVDKTAAAGNVAAAGKLG